MALTAIESVLAAALAAVLWLVAERRPLAVFAAAAKRLVSDPAFRTPLLFLLGVLAFNFIETALDDRLTARLGYEATGWIHRLEGERVAALQRPDWKPLIAAFTAIYIVGFPAIVAAPLLLAAADGDEGRFRAFCRGLIANYLVCLPFYLFVPVREVWAFHGSGARLLVDRLSPAIMEGYRASSALDNCFPSFHTSLAVTFAALALRSGPRRLAAAIAFLSSAVVLSTIYLGIHWLTDVGAGIVLGGWGAWRGGLEIARARRGAPVEARR